MAKKKYIKDEKGIVRASTTNTLGLEKPLLSDNYDINVHNANMDKIDVAIQDVKGKVDGLELKAEKVTIADTNNYFASNNVEGALNELAGEINGQRVKLIDSVNKIVDLIY